MKAENSGSLEGSRSFDGSTTTAMEAANPRLSPDTGESPFDGQDLPKTDPETDDVKLRRATEQINLLEGKLQQAVNENAKLKVKQTEDAKLWQGLDPKLSSTKTLCDQLTETQQQLASQTEQETPVDGQDSLKTDPETDDVKLRGATEQINPLEGKLQQAVNENAKLKVKQTEDAKLWQGLDSKLSSTKTLCDQLTETLQRLASQTEQAEEDKKFFEEKLGKNSKAMDEFSCLLCDLSSKLEDAEQKIISGREEMFKIKQEKEEMDRNYQEQLYSNDSTIKGKDSLIKQLEGSVEGHILEIEKLSNRKQELLQKILKLESDNQELLGQVQSLMEEKSKLDQQVNTLKNQINQLHSVLDEKEQLYRCSVEREKTLEDQKLQIEALLSATVCQHSEAKKQCDLMLEDAKIQLSKHLKEHSLKNDQAINEIRKKYELEKIEITNAEKEKAEKLISEIESKCNEKISQNKHDFDRDLIFLKKEHGTMVARTQQDIEHKESALWAYHKEELQHIQSLAEIELRERLSLLRKEHELEIQSLRIHHAEACQRMQEELELQKSKEEKQRSLLLLQWKEMRENHQVDQEVSSMKIPSNTYVLSMNTNIAEAPMPPRPQKDDNIWDKRQIMYVLVLTTTIGLVFLLQPLLPVDYARWIIAGIAALWGIGSFALPVGLYGTSRHERDFSRYTGRLVYMLFSVLVIYSYYLLAMHTGDTSASSLSPSLSPPLKESAADVSKDTWWTAGFGVIGLFVVIGNIWSSIRGCLTGGDRDP